MLYWLEEIFTFNEDKSEESKRQCQNADQYRQRDKADKTKHDNWREWSLLCQQSHLFQPGLRADFIT